MKSNSSSARTMVWVRFWAFCAAAPKPFELAPFPMIGTTRDSWRPKGQNPLVKPDGDFLASFIVGALWTVVGTTASDSAMR
jgi:hypothetical protein